MFTSIGFGKKYIFLCGMMLVLLGLFIIGLKSYRLLYQPMPMEQGKSLPPVLALDKTTTAYSLVRTLKTNHLIQSDRLLLLLIRLQGLSSKLKAGVYKIQANESAWHFLQRVVSGDVLQVSFQITEGHTQAQVAKKLQHADYLTYQPEHWQGVLSTFPSVEGGVLADTYYYNAGSLSKDLLSRAHIRLTQVLEKIWQERAPNLPYTSSYQLLITASILEKEAALPSEKRLIAGVIVNRLRKNMPLQMDPTVIYALGSLYSGKLAKEQLKVDSPYNSYRYRGLPPTPIAIVGKEAIQAAAHPDLTEYLYFVAKGDGSHHFSATYEEQRKAINRYLKGGHG